MSRKPRQALEIRKTNKNRKATLLYHASRTGSKPKKDGENGGKKSEKGVSHRRVLIKGLVGSNGDTRSVSSQKDSQPHGGGKEAISKKERITRDGEALISMMRMQGDEARLSTAGGGEKSSCAKNRKTVANGSWPSAEPRVVGESETVSGKPSGKVSWVISIPNSINKRPKSSRTLGLGILFRTPLGKRGFQQGEANPKPEMQAKEMSSRQGVTPGSLIKDLQQT